MFHRILFLTLLLFLQACGPPVPDNHYKTPSPYDGYSEEAVKYFLKIGFCSEFGDCIPGTRKWTTNVRIQLNGQYLQEDEDELDRIIYDLRELTNLSIKKVNNGSANINIYYVPENQFTKCLSNYTDIDSQDAIFNASESSGNQITSARICIETPAAQLKKNHLLREELTQSFGIYNDSYDYTNSIFQQDPQYRPTEYAPIDKEVIRLLYDPRIYPGMNANEFLATLKNDSSQIVVSN